VATTPQPPAPTPHDITPVSLKDEMERSYLDYAMSVIVARALPDVRDGLKPVHRRILYAMQEAGYDWNRAHRKSARVVGDVMGKYHPHGDTAIYDAMVRMAQDFSMRLQLVDGQGNFGSMDGDPPAAMRYTEVRLARAAHDLLEDIDRETVDFQPNYDDTMQEPSVLPAKFPNLLVNGAGGIAVGMATNIPTHNLGEVIDATLALLADPSLAVADLMKFIPGPDFPTGGIVFGASGIRLAYETGRGTVVMRGRAHIEEIRKDREAIIITEIPYQVNKARMVERIAEMVRDKRIDGISELRDESDRDGARVVVEIKRDAVADVVLNQLFRYTPLQSTFGIIMLALDHGRPVLMSLKTVISAFITFREDVIRRRTLFELKKARDRAHVLVGLAIAVANIDAVIALIRKSKDPAEARAALTGRDWPAGDVTALVELIDEPGHKVVDGRYRLSDGQARAILDLRLQRLTALERGQIAEELAELSTQITDFLSILGSIERVREILRQELLEMRERYATPRKTSIEESAVDTDIEDLIQPEDMVVTVTHDGYIKRVPLASYRAQRRGGRGRAGMQTKEEDFVTRLFVCNTHTPMLFFSSRGIVYRLKVYMLPEGTPQARGKALVNLLPLKEGETITVIMPMPVDEAEWDKLSIMFATATGNVRRNRLSDFTNIMANGKIAMKLDEGDRLVGAQTCDEEHDVLLAARGGKCIRFAVTDVRVFESRSSTGVRGMRLAKADEVISMSMLRHVEAETTQRDEYLAAVAAKRRLAGSDYTEREEDKKRDQAIAAKLQEDRLVQMAASEEFILTVTDDGFGKRTSAYEYRITGRGGSGIENIDLARGKGIEAKVAASFPIGPQDQIMLVTADGQLIRCPVRDVRIAGRNTKGVTLFKTEEGERIASVARIEESVDGGPAGGNGRGNGAGNGAGNGTGHAAEAAPESGLDELDGADEDEAESDEPEGEEDTNG
jgi:DNA gyrase subunit A